MNARLSSIRNIGIIAHIDAGKTTTTERVLHHTGLTHRIGSVDDGTTVTDFMPQERERGITIQSAAVTCEWRGCQINLIDTPGHIDFTAEVQRSLRVLDGGVVVFDGVAGVEPQSETVWRQADKAGVPRIGFVNKMDRVGADLSQTLAMVRDRLGAMPLLVQMPIGHEAAFRGLIDLVSMKAYLFLSDETDDIGEIEIPLELQAEAHTHRFDLLEDLAEVDDEVMAAYLEGEPLSPDDLKQAIRRATLAHKLVPFLCGSSLRNKGIQLLLDSVVDYLPSPLDMPALVGTSPMTGESVSCVADPSDATAALAFKIATDPYMGRLTYFRVYSGTVRRGESLVNARTGQRERVGRLVRIHADRREDIEELGAGDIGAILGLKNAATGDTLCSADRLVRLEPISFPTPVVHIAVEPRSRADEDKMDVAISRLADEDPTIVVRQDERSGQRILSGMGELHLDVFVDRMKREFGVDVRVGEPEVAYCETITRPVRAEARLVKQTGGHGQYAHVVLELEPLPAGSGFAFVDRLRGASIPRTYVPAIEAGVRDGLQRGVLAHNPLVDIKATLIDGSYHEVDSSDMAFRTAASMAVRDGALRAAPVILEPVMRVEVVAPDEYTGEVMSELNLRRASVTGMDARASMQTIRAHVPLATMFGYATSLRSRTQGRGTFTMEFDHYARVSADLMRRLTDKVA